MWQAACVSDMPAMADVQPQPERPRRTWLAALVVVVLAVLIVVIVLVSGGSNDAAPDRSLSAGDRAAVIQAVQAIETACPKPSAATRPAAVAAVDTLIGMLGGSGDRVFKGPPYDGLAVHDIVANVGGLLNKDGCAPDLGSKVAVALTKG